jgi:hypothetical protein
MKKVALSFNIHNPNKGIVKNVTRYFPRISKLYEEMYAIATSATHVDVISVLEAQGVQVIPQTGGGVGLEYIGDARRQALQVSIRNDNEYTHFIEFDRLLQWVSSHPNELQEVVEKIPDYDFLVLGRTPRAFNTHTRCQIETETISNKVISLIIGNEMDFTCASRGISRNAGEVILEKSTATHVSTDSEWPIIIKYLTDFPIGYIQVDGLEFESLFRAPGRVKEAGGLEAFKKGRDCDPESWLHRIRLAEQICSTAITTYNALAHTSARDG